MGTRFATAYAGYRFDDTTASIQNRVRPFATTAFVDRIAASSSAAQLWADRRQRHEAATPTIPAVQCGGFDDRARLACTAQLTETTTSDGGSTTATRFLEMFLVETDAGWRVDEVQE